MGKKRKGQVERQQAGLSAWPGAWPEEDGVHARVPGSPPSAEVLEEMTRVSHERILS